MIKLSKNLLILSNLVTKKYIFTILFYIQYVFKYFMLIFHQNNKTLKG